MLIFLTFQFFLYSLDVPIYMMCDFAHISVPKCISATFWPLHFPAWRKYHFRTKFVECFIEKLVIFIFEISRSPVCSAVCSSEKILQLCAKAIFSSPTFFPQLWACARHQLSICTLNTYISAYTHFSCAYARYQLNMRVLQLSTCTLPVEHIHVYLWNLEIRKLCIYIYIYIYMLIFLSFQIFSFLSWCSNIYEVWFCSYISSKMHFCHILTFTFSRMK